LRLTGYCLRELPKQPTTRSGCWRAASIHCTVIRQGSEEDAVLVMLEEGVHGNPRRGERPAAYLMDALN
jgi:hypothetical protein